MAEMLELESQTEQSRYKPTMLGILFATLVRRAVAGGRAWVDENGVAHPLDQHRQEVVEYPHRMILPFPKESEDPDAA